MKKLTKVLLASTVAVSLIGGVAFAQKDSDGRESRMISHLSKKLELDDNQSAALADLQTQFKASKEATGDREAMAEKLKALITADTFDQAAALNLLNEKADAMRASAPNVVASAAVFLDGLNAEQKAELADMMDKMGGRMHGKRGGKRGDKHEKSHDSDENSDDSAAKE